jgi:phage terminase large subunit-like protein
MKEKQHLNDLFEDPVRFLESKYGYYVSETKKPIQHQDWERKVLHAILSSNKKIRAIGDIKKNLKTTKAAEIVYVTALQYPNSEIYIISNDYEQSKSRVFHYLIKSLELNQYITAGITQNQIKFSNGTYVKALPSDYRGEAGANPRLTVFDEPWGFVSENAMRMVEEFTPPPNIAESFQLFTGYAGFENEGKLWGELYQQGLQGEKVSTDLPLYETDEILMYWSHGPLEGDPGQPWHTGAYFATQEKTLRPFQFLRMHRNQWVSGSESFISRESWRACVDENYCPPLPDRNVTLWVGVDCGTKSDNAAVVSVWVDYAQHKVALGPHRLWKPSKREPLDIGATIGEYLRWLDRHYRVAGIWCDPWQLHQLITELMDEGLPIEEFAQTPANLTRTTLNLYDLLSQKNLILTSDSELEDQSQNAVAVESSRGLRLAKEKSSKKIGAVVALSIGCLFATEEMHCVPLDPNARERSAFQLQGEAEERSYQNFMNGGLGTLLPESMLGPEERAAERFRRDGEVDENDWGDDCSFYNDSPFGF